MKTAIAISALLSLSGCANVYSSEPSCGEVGSEWEDWEMLAMQKGIDRLCAALPESCGEYEVWQFRPIRTIPPPSQFVAVAFDEDDCVEVYTKGTNMSPGRLEFVTVHESMHLAGARGHVDGGNVSNSLDHQINTEDLQHLCDQGGYDCTYSYPEVP
jgi:hypothetical protein